MSDDPSSYGPHILHRVTCTSGGTFLQPLQIYLRVLSVNVWFAVSFRKNSRVTGHTQGNLVDRLGPQKCADPVYILCLFPISASLCRHLYYITPFLERQVKVEYLWIFHSVRISGLYFLREHRLLQFPKILMRVKKSSITVIERLCSLKQMKSYRRR